MVRSSRAVMTWAVWLMGSTLAWGAGSDRVPAPLQGVRFDQRLNVQVPMDARFTDAHGRPVELGTYFGDKPVILVLAYYRCPRLCTLVLNGVVQGLLQIPFNAGREFEVLTVSFDPREDWKLAAAKKKSYIRRYGRPGAEEGWHFLTGQEDQIRRLTDAVGFHYRYDPKKDQFIHASGIIILTPSGRTSRYFYDVEYPARDLRLGLVEASQNRIGTPVDQILLYCFHYDPAVGRYSASIMNFVRVGGVLTLLAIGWFLWMLQRVKRGRTALGIPGGAGPAGGLKSLEGSPGEGNVWKEGS